MGWFTKPAPAVTCEDQGWPEDEPLPASYWDDAIAHAADARTRRRLEEAKRKDGYR